ncbi:hypothetical protein EIN_096680 [Entamoeba invadens IP1]|uniref:Major facilitator superfamily (MFS) profile domain-containing protein n=1 Tax=Entamoeba invadens IP1 TaxID=370355 RepID=A0A0A1U6G7_ENTIV|nr:hypothetical protein EIN_096680 [Entamoeba invadens IP1]ELP87401.1 hypothetical protein EIN_096680 [Entamoeba invadens IP1]|eukprot:XP_004254172.1 hypothetical protein EIN_096680 [Entamoeba invadens IP1]
MENVLKYPLRLLDNYPRHLLSGLLYNTSGFLFWIVVPLLFNEQGASAIELALLQTICFVIFAALAPFGGKISDLISPFIVVRISLVLLTIGEAIVAIWPTNKAAIYISCAFWAFSAFLFWPAAVGTVGKESKPGKEARNSGLFAVSWSFGKSIGYVVGGSLKAALGASTSLYISIGINALIFLVYPYTHVKWLKDKLIEEKQKKQQMEEELKDEENVNNKEKDSNGVDIKIENNDVVIPNEMAKELGIPKIEKPLKSETKMTGKVKWTEEQLKNKTYIFLGYIMQLGVFGSSSILTNQYIKVADAKSIGIPIGGDPEDNFVAWNFFILYFSQTLTFIAMSITDKWTYHRSLILAAMTIFMMYLTVLVLVFNPYVIFVASFFAGIATGFSYQTSTYYSLKANDKSKSLFVGFNEGVAALSNALLPLFAALLSESFGVFSTIYLAIAVVLFCLVIIQIVYHIASRVNASRQSKRNGTITLHRTENSNEEVANKTDITIKEEKSSKSSSDSTPL